MQSLLLNSVLTLVSLGVLASALLYFVSKKFFVFYDPLIDEVEEVLPSANCGGCGFPGCRTFAEELVAKKSVDGLFCPVGGNETMADIGKILGVAVEVKERSVAVLKCQGSKQHTSGQLSFQGASSCLLADQQFAGEHGCQYGCLGLADCVKVCEFDALAIDMLTGLPTVNEQKCTGCNACADICPRSLLEIRPITQRLYVACRNEEKGAVAKKNCSVACIGCQKCTKVYEGAENSIVVENFLSTMAPTINLKFSEELISCCPTQAIVDLNREADCVGA